MITPSYFSGVRYVSDGDAKFPAKVEKCKVRHECSDGFTTVYQESPWQPTGEVVADEAELKDYESSLW